MTSTPVKNVDVGPVGMMPINTRSASDGGFQTVWDSRMQKRDTGSPEEGSQGEGIAGTVKKTPGESLKARDEHRARTERREPSRNVEERTDIPEEKLAEAEGVLAAAAEGMLQEIAEILGVDVQEVTDSLAELDMSVTDILSPGKLGELLLHVRDAGDASALLTDEGIYGDFQKLTALLAETLRESGEKLEISPEETKQILEQLEEAGRPGQPETLELSDQSESVDRPGTAGTAEQAAASGKTETAETGMPQREPEIIVEITGSRESRPKQDAKPEGEPGEAIPGQSPEENEAGETLRKPAAEFRGEGRENHRHGGDREQGGSLFAQNLRAEQFEARMGTEPVAESAGGTGTEQIMRQIMDYMKINLKPEISSMEMQLHPASLGTLQIHIVSKGGVITANFLTQNEAVKAALESQMVHLKEQFAEQGVKVEAVEVTVQTHEFERNLDQGREGRGQNRESARRGRSRRLRLDDAPGGEGTLQDGPQTELPTGGSTVDYMA